jgi:DNA-binding NtrC family response regulator
MMTSASNNQQLLVVDDDITTGELLQAAFEERGFRVSRATDLTSMRARLRERSFDCVLLDLFLGSEMGLEALPELVREYPYTKVFVMSASGTVQLAVDALEKGASTFLCKSKDPRELVPVVVEKLAAVSPAGSVSGSQVTEAAGLVGRSGAMRELAEKVQRFASIDSTVVVTGESGTGKELVARAIHRLSPRANGRFEAVNCGAIPENLLESELFGHRRGAFTDAKTDRKGLFEICDGGTLFLDEIGEMPLSLQVKLLRVLQEFEVMPLGAGSPVRVNTRVICATNRNLAREVEQGRFRADLYYRISVLHVHLPPLRERASDIPLLVESFLEKFNRRFHRDIAPPSRELMARLETYSWPGNIRELQNAVERAVVLSTDGQLHLEHMFDPSTRTDEDPTANAGEDRTSALWSSPLSEAKRHFEKAYLEHLLEVTGGNVSEVARLSGRYRTDIHRLLSKYGVESSTYR